MDIYCKFSNKHSCKNYTIYSQCSKLPEKKALSTRDQHVFKECLILKYFSDFHKTVHKYHSIRRYPSSRRFSLPAFNNSKPTDAQTCIAAATLAPLTFRIRNDVWKKIFGGKIWSFAARKIKIWRSREKFFGIQCDGFN
jgi:hypothetical protein